MITLGGDAELELVSCTNSDMPHIKTSAHGCMECIDTAHPRFASDVLDKSLGIHQLVGRHVFHMLGLKLGRISSKSVCIWVSQKVLMV